MLLWIALAVGWVAVLVLAISLFRVTAYAEKKIRGLAQRSAQRDDQVA
jgi:hypothetical protein